MSLYPQTVIQSNILTIYQGADFSVTVTIVDDTTGEPIPGFESSTVAAMLRTLDGNLAATFIPTITGPTSCKLDLLDPQTSVLVAATSVNHIWGIKVTMPDGEDIPEFQGGAIVRVRVVQ